MPCLRLERLSPWPARVVDAPINVGVECQGLVLRSDESFQLSTISVQYRALQRIQSFVADGMLIALPASIGTSF
jgi:hypothetical protein